MKSYIITGIITALIISIGACGVGILLYLTYPAAARIAPFIGKILTRGTWREWVFFSWFFAGFLFPFRGIVRVVVNKGK